MGKRALEVFQLVTRLIDRIFKGAVNMQECAFALAMPVFRKLLLKEGMAFLDQKCPKSMEKLMTIQENFSNVLKGLRTIGGEYTIKVKENATLNTIYTPRRVPFQLRGRFQKELDLV